MSKRTLTSIVLCIIVMLSSLSISVKAAKDDIVEYIDIILVLDCSGSMVGNDANDIRRSGAMNAIDNLPMHLHARIGVIAFGQKEWDKPYSFSAISDTSGHGGTVKEVFPLTCVDDNEQTITDVKAAINEAYDTVKAEKADENGQYSTITKIEAALLAVEDMLIRGNSVKSAVFILTDGVQTNYLNNHSGFDSIFKGFSKFVNNAQPQIPVYTIGLNYKKNPTNEDAEIARRIFKKFAEEINKGGYYPVDNENDLAKTITMAYADLFGGNIEGKTVYLDENGEYSWPFTISELVVEEIINVYGGKIDVVNISTKTGSDSWDDRTEEAKTTYSVTPWYWNFKLVRPESGEWRLMIRGDKNAKVEIYAYGIREVELQLKADSDIPAQENNAYLKGTKLTITAELKYDNEVIGSPDFYKNHSITLVVIHNDVSSEIELYADDGLRYYRYELTLDSVGEWSVYTILREDELLGDGVEKRSNKEDFPVYGSQEVFADDFVIENRTCHIGELIDKIYLTGIKTAFVESDVYIGGIKAFLVDSHSESAALDDAVAEDASGIYLQFKAPEDYGKYNVILKAVDEDGNYGTRGFELDVINDLPEVLKDEVDLGRLTANKWFNENDSETVTIDLNDYFRDPEGRPMSFTVTVSDDNVVRADVAEGVFDSTEPCPITFTGVGKGKADIVITVLDDGNHPEHFAKSTLSVSSTNWYLNFIWVPFALAAVVGGVLFVRKLHRKNNPLFVQGAWKVTVSNNEKQFTPPRFTSLQSGNKYITMRASKIDLADLVRLAVEKGGGNGNEVTVSPGGIYLCGSTADNGETKMLIKSKAFSVSVGNENCLGSSVVLINGIKVVIKEGSTLVTLIRG